MPMTGNLCLSPRAKQFTDQLSRPFSPGGYHMMMISDCRTPRTPKDLLPQHPFWNSETLQFAPTPRQHVNNSYEASSGTPKFRRPGHQFYDSEMTTQVTRPSRLIQASGGMSFEAYSQQFFSQYRFSTTPRTTTTTEATTTTTTTTTTITTTPTISKEEDEEEDEEILLGFIERLNKVDIESSEFLSMFPKPEEAIQLVECLRARVEDPEVRSIWDLLEQLPSNLRDQVDMEGIGFSMAKQRGLYVHSESCKKLERFKVRTLDLGGGVVVKNKLERFKVRTLDLGGIVVKEEGTSQMKM